jgi:hypothetical protein
VPLYFGGAELKAYYPLSAIADGQGLNITVISYRDSMFFGLIACRELVPDLDVMAEYVQQELATLLVATASAPAEKARRTVERTPARNESRR